MYGVEFTVWSTTRYPTEPLEFFAAKGIKSFVSGGVLYKSCFVAKSVVAVFSHTMEVSLMLAIVATSKLTILVEPLNEDRIEELIEELHSSTFFNHAIP